MTVFLEVTATHRFLVHRDAASADEAMREVEHELTGRCSDPRDPLQGFTVREAEAVSERAA